MELEVKNLPFPFLPVLWNRLEILLYCAGLREKEKKKRYKLVTFQLKILINIKTVELYQNRLSLMLQKYDT